MGDHRTSTWIPNCLASPAHNNITHVLGFMQFASSIYPTRTTESCLGTDTCHIIFVYMPVQTSQIRAEVARELIEMCKMPAYQQLLPVSHIVTEHNAMLALHTPQWGLVSTH